jgi:DNA-binding NarL/FixJ family response regulator
MAANPSTVRSVIVSPSLDLRDGLVHLVADDPRLDVIAWGRTQRDALRLCAEHAPAVMAIDQRVEEDHGVEVAEAVVAASKGATRVVLSLRELREATLTRALNAGVGAVVLQRDGHRWMIGAILALAAGGSLLSPTVSQWAIGDAGRDTTLRSDDTGLTSLLTPRERQILRLVGLGLSNGEIAHQLTLSEATVKTHVTHLFLKLDVSDRANAVVVAFRSGLVVPTDR